MTTRFIWHRYLHGIGSGQGCGYRVQPLPGDHRVARPAGAVTLTSRSLCLLGCA